MPQRGWAEQFARAYQAQPAESRKPVLAVLGFGDSAKDSRIVLEAQGIPVYDYPESAALVMENLVRYSMHRK